MDTYEKIKEAKDLYRRYLSLMHPEWAESSVSTHVSDAFYIWNSTILPGFWKVFQSEESMESARIAICEHLQNEVKSDNYEIRAKVYFKDLQMLKAYLDAEHGGVKQYVGDEFEAEEQLYTICKACYQKKLSEDQALEEMRLRIPYFSTTSHKMILSLFTSMVEGRKYTRRGNVEITVTFIHNIGRDYGMDAVKKALNTTRENIIYYFGKTGNKSNCMRKSCQKISNAYRCAISFGDEIFTGIIPQKDGVAIGDVDVDTVRYWLYSPGDNACKWDEFYSSGVMGLSWSEIGDLTKLSSKEAIKLRMKEAYGEEYSYKNAVHAVWQFANEIKPGDIVFCKKGLHKIIGRGIVTGDYQYKSVTQDGDYCQTRKVNWTHRGEWPHPGQAAMKTLTDITPYTDYVEKLNALFANEEEAYPVEAEPAYPLYNVEQFLEEVFMDEADYITLTGLIRTKKNVILQGAPGVGKTFVAKRLAYSMIGQKDPDRVMLVQFHQSYTYEDFIEGYRPASTSGGFEIKKGAFYNFCKKAAEDLDNEYFFIIDEINRGNLSKIFGELFMLIENDKRGNSLQLLYSDEKFNVPPNVYIIGMMNTADRSLALLDYALRRRFAFYTMEPQFHSEGFQNYRGKLKNLAMEKLIACVQALNGVISADDSLGKGFCIGHSYFCNISEVTDDTLRNIVEYELIPLLNEYWFDEPVKVNDWSERLRSAIK